MPAALHTSISREPAVARMSFPSTVIFTLGMIPPEDGDVETAPAPLNPIYPSSLPNPGVDGQLGAGVASAIAPNNCDVVLVVRTMGHLSRPPVTKDPSTCLFVVGTGTHAGRDGRSLESCDNRTAAWYKQPIECASERLETEMSGQIDPVSVPEQLFDSVR